LGCKEKDNTRVIVSFQENLGNEKESNGNKFMSLEDNNEGNEISSKTVTDVVQADEADFVIDETGTINEIFWQG
jgi:hypothetical protein